MLASLVALAGVSTFASSDAPKPHIFFALVDDLGWGNVGFHRTDNPDYVITPTMDQLAKEGVDLYRHYVYYFCTPTRSSVQSGRLPVHVNIGLGDIGHSNTAIPRNMTGMAEVLKRAGYATHFVGKWDAGMATPKHTPHGRGYDTSLNYFDHKNDFYNQIAMQSSCSHYAKNGTGPVDLWDTDRPAHHLNGTGYEEYIFRDRLYNITTKHDTSVPLMLFFASHVAHCPLQVPEEYFKKFAKITAGNDEPHCKAQSYYVNPDNHDNFQCRAQYNAMVNLLDDTLKNITDVFKDRGLWENTLMVLSTDNGAPPGTDETGGNNYPLRGAKYSSWEGGIRATSFVSGGFVPKSVRGTVSKELLHIADWYATFAYLAGEDPTDTLAAENGLPPIDSINIWPIFEGKPSPRLEIFQSPDVYIYGSYKLLVGQQGEASWSSPVYPNSSSTYIGGNKNCTNGCLYNLDIDMEERNDIAGENPSIVEKIRSKLDKAVTTLFNNNDTLQTSCPPNIHGQCACWIAENRYGNFMGPFAELEDL